MVAERRLGRPAVPGFLLTGPLLVVASIGPLLYFDANSWSGPVAAGWLASTLGAAALLFKFRSIDEESLWLWVFVFLFVIGYFGKTFFVYEWLAAERDVRLLSHEWHWIDETDLKQAYLVSVAAFLAFVAAALMVRTRKSGPDHSGPFCGRRSRTALAVCVMSAVALGAARAAFGIGVMGVETSELPLGFDTLIFRAQSSLLPAILVTLAWVGSRNDDKVLTSASLLTLALHFIVLAGISASKAGVIQFIVLAVFFWICTRTMSTKKFAMLGLLGAAAIVFFALGSELRLMRVAGLDLGESLSALDGFAQIQADALRHVLTALFLRVSGVDGLWYVVGQVQPTFVDVARLPEIARQGLVEFFTRDVVGVTWLQDFRAPGFVAAFLMLVGYVGVVMVFAVVIAVGLGWRALGSSSARVPMRVFLGAFLLQYMMEGIFRWQDLAATAAGCVAIVATARWLARRSPDSTTGDRPAA